jgi:hypothetical protein
MPGVLACLVLGGAMQGTIHMLCMWIRISMRMLVVFHFIMTSMMFVILRSSHLSLVSLFRSGFKATEVPLKLE